MYEKISNPTIHCFAAAYIAETGRFMFFDAVERLRGEDAEMATRNLSFCPRMEPLGVVAAPKSRPTYFLLDFLPTGESVMKYRYLRGPFTPVQADLDNLLDTASSGNSKFTLEEFQKQNELFEAAEAFN